MLKLRGESKGALGDAYQNRTASNFVHSERMSMCTCVEVN